MRGSYMQWTSTHKALARAAFRKVAGGGAPGLGKLGKPKWVGLSGTITHLQSEAPEVWERLSVSTLKGWLNAA